MSQETPPSFSELGLAKPLLQAIDDVGYEAPSAIQAAAIPPLLAGKDLLGQAQTGSGKTAAFALPLLSQLDVSQKRPQVLVLTPTRELAIQVAEAMQTYARRLKGFHVLPVYGGQSIETQLRQLRRGVHVVVGTPGRIQDHLRRRTLILDSLKAVVLDEADEMLRMGFIEEVEQILEHTPEDKQVALFSATMPAPIRRVAQKYLRDPVTIQIETKTATVDTVEQLYWRVAGVHKLDALTRILEVEDFDAMLVFVRTRIATTELADRLEARGFASAALNGDMNQALRERTVDRLKKGKLDILVATDVAARGLDVNRISHVINFDIPYDVEAYVHRIGRTARAGRSGKAILFVSPRERRMLYAIERVTRQQIQPMQLPTRADIANRRVTQFKQLITETIEGQDLDFFNKVIDSYQREQDVDLPQVASALAYLVQRERPLLAPRSSRTERPAPTRGDQRSAPPREGGPQHHEHGSRQKPRDERPRQGHRDDDYSDVRMRRYRIEVGRSHGVQPGNIVGAISNEAELDGKLIGHITLHDTFSLVDLPDGMPQETYKHLQSVQVCGQALRLSLDATASTGGTTPRKRKAARADKPRHSKLRGKKKAKVLGKKKRVKPGKKKPRDA